MKKISLLLVLCMTIFSAQSQKTFYSYTAVTINGDTIDLSKYHGKKLLVVNTASFCQYTYEFGILQQLYTQYKKYNFEIIGFPCNDFGGQDPHSDSAINAFCTGNYNVTFQMMSRVDILAHDTAEVYKWLMHKELNGVQSGTISWNFNKFLIDEAGHWVRHLLSPVSPLDTSITNWIMSPSVLPPNIIYTSEHALTGAPEETFNRQGDIATGVQPQEPGAQIELRSANPAVSTIDLSLPAYKHLSIKIYSIDGRYIDAVYEGESANGQLISYPVAGIPAGIYFISIIADGKQQTLKVAVTR